MLMTRPPSSPRLPRMIRAEGGVRLAIGADPRRGGAPMRIAESGGYRVRFPRGRICEGVFINTGGGMTGGDRLGIDVTLADGAEAALTTQAAEKIYRSDHDDTEVTVSLDLAPGAGLAWLPQEQILFDEARLRRRFEVAMAADARLILLESTIFGRTAMGESVNAGRFRDSWRIRRAGRLIFAEEVRLEDTIAQTLARGAVAGGAHAFATCLIVAPDAEARLEEARALLVDAPSTCGISALDGFLVARFLSHDAQALRGTLIRFVEAMRGHAMPRSWMI
ncbi:urease accessory protein UreD [Saliniramus sp.]|uniref:urease accessory protein UreD n=1 Tax=Saliniramus sp. TaxID=2986772 RepID=UPI002B656ECF|nr:urease accessory protein UreD [Saliniramus sp.]HMB09940.1 urease accessory protein UreD [Saliniramus sp.]